MVQGSEPAWGGDHRRLLDPHARSGGEPGARHFKGSIVPPIDDSIPQGHYVLLIRQAEADRLRGWGTGRAGPQVMIAMPILDAMPGGQHGEGAWFVVN